MARLAFTTFAIMKAPYGREVVRGFEERTPPVFEAAEGSEGFIARATEIDYRPELSNFEQDWGEWGKFATPRFYKGGTALEEDSRASTLSLWRDLESVHRFVYSGLHVEALRKRHEWFLKPQWPTYAMWWVADSRVPTWEEAAWRLEHLHDHGSTPVAFDFHKPFDELGREVAIRPSRTRRQPADGHGPEASAPAGGEVGPMAQVLSAGERPDDP
jgi:hypothetical protein